MEISDGLARMLWWGTGLSVLALLAAAVGIPFAVARLPRDYFRREERTAWRLNPHRPLAGLVLSVAKNVLGAVVVVLGVIMLVTPGQGLLTILIGLLLLNFPGKYRLERWLVLQPGVLRALNWVRARNGQAAFDEPPDPG